MAYDPARKLLFSHPRMVEDLLRGFVAKRWSHALDFSTLEPRSAASVSDDLRRREGDLSWRVRLGGTWLYVQLEFQSTVDPTMAVRLLTRTGLLYQDLLRHGEAAPGGKLPLVLSVVLYNGRRSRWTAATELGQVTVPAGEGLERYQPALRYELLDVKGYRADDLPARNLVSALIGLENSRTVGELERWLGLLLEWVRARNGWPRSESGSSSAGQALNCSTAPEERAAPRTDDHGFTGAHWRRSRLSGRQAWRSWPRGEYRDDRTPRRVGPGGSRRVKIGAIAS